MVLDQHLWLSKAFMVGFTIQLMHLEWQNWVIIPYNGGVQTEMFHFCFNEDMEEISKDQFYRRSSRRVIPTAKDYPDVMLVTQNLNFSTNNENWIGRNLDTFLPWSFCGSSITQCEEKEIKSRIPI